MNAYLEVFPTIWHWLSDTCHKSYDAYILTQAIFSVASWPLQFLPLIQQPMEMGKLMLMGKKIEARVLETSDSSEAVQLWVERSETSLFSKLILPVISMSDQHIWGGWGCCLQTRYFWSRYDDSLWFAGFAAPLIASLPLPSHYLSVIHLQLPNLGICGQLEC